MKWIKLKIYKGEELLSELETVQSKYDNLINEVRCADLNDNQPKIEFLSFREEIEQRIIELDEFYQLNINDSRISIFEKVRNKLALLLDININSEEGNKIILKRYGKIWDISNQVNKKELKDYEEKKLNNAKENSIKYWRNNDEMRQNESAFPLNYDKKKNEIIRYFKKYRTPYQKNVDYYRTMQKIKEDTFVEREQAEKKVKYKNPGAEKYPEKIRALVQKEMYNLYKYKYNEKTGKLSKEELLKKKKMKIKIVI